MRETGQQTTPFLTQPVSSTGSATAEIARVTAFADGTALAALGDFSLKASASVFTDKQAPNGDTGVATAVVNATNEDTIALRTETIPFGNSLLIRAKLTVDGSFVVDLPITPAHQDPFDPRLIVPASRGSVGGGLGIFASKGSFIDGGGPSATLAGLCINLCVSGDGEMPPVEFVTWSFVTKNGELTPMSYGVELNVKALASTGNEAVIIGNFTGSIHWGGIQSVEDAVTGEVINDWTITSQSGFDYSKSFEAQIPEPSSLMLLATALCAPLALGRRRPTRVESK
jgi:hypothetical protein